MSDAYLSFANSPFGGALTRSLGLPQPRALERFSSHRPVLRGEVLVGASPGAQLLPSLSQSLAELEAPSLAHHSLPEWITLAQQQGVMSGRWGVGEAPGAKVKALVFDATGLSDPLQSETLHAFFQHTLPHLLPCGRVIVLARPPEQAATLAQAVAQRALEGFVRAVAKELRQGATAQLLWVEEGAEANLGGALGFFLSPRSAYVSGQSLRLQPASLPPHVPTQPLAGRQILVTGAARGIGVAVAETLARDGARVIALDVPSAQEPLQALAKRIGGQALALDITDPEAPTTLVRAALAEGGWDGLVHNAGITRDRSLARMPAHQWALVQAINLQAPITITQAMQEAQALRKGARVVGVSSISGIAGNRGQTNYGYSKAGVIGWVQALAPQWQTQALAINAVAPGFIETQMTAAIPLAIREAGRRMNSLGQGGLPVDVAEAIAWLVGPQAAGVNGQVLRVCGQNWLGA